MLIAVIVVVARSSFPAAQFLRSDLGHVLLPYREEEEEEEEEEEKSPRRSCRLIVGRVSSEEAQPTMTATSRRAAATSAQRPSFWTG